MENMMKKITLLLVFALFFAVTAHAGVREFNSMSLDVPDGWLAQEQGPSVMAMDPDQTSILTVTLMPAQDRNTRQLAEYIAESMQGATLKDEGDDLYSATIDMHGQKSILYVRVMNNKGVLCTTVGNSPELPGIAKSVQLK